MAIRGNADLDQDIFWSQILGDRDSIDFIGFVKLDYPFSLMPCEQT
jgi:hypothetical protein